MKMQQRAPVRGVFKMQLVRGGKVVAEQEFPNGITDEGANNIWDVYFGSGTQITSWYMGLIDSSGYSALAAGDTMSSHAGWTELTAYGEATRPAFTPDAAASRAIANTTLCEFTFNATKTVKGGFITSNSTKAGTTGKLWCTALLTTAQDVVNGDVMRFTYSATMS